MASAHSNPFVHNDSELFVLKMNVSLACTTEEVKSFAERVLAVKMMLFPCQGQNRLHKGFQALTHARPLRAAALSLQLKLFLPTT